MKSFTIAEVISACSGEYIGDAALLSTELSAIVTDSRKVKKGAMFAAIKGEKFDGHDFISSCIANGAAAALCEKRVENAGGPCIVVPSVLTALTQIAEAYRLKFDIPFIGISGSVGKTSTKEMVSAVLSQKFHTLKTQGNLNNELGVPLTLFELDDTHEAAVIEMGISDFKEMERLSKMVKPDVCILTNIGYCHLENLGDRNGVLKAKTEMFTYMNENGAVFLNGGDDKLSTVKAVKNARLEFFGNTPDCSVWAEDVQNNGENGITCTVCTGDKRLPVKINAIGSYMVTNTLAAVAVGRYLGLSDEQLINGVASYKTIGGRANVIKLENGVTVIDDCYNANPMSMKGAVESLAGFSGRKIAVLGDMKELGEDEISLHSMIGEVVKNQRIDVLFTVGELALNIAKASDMNAFSFLSLDDAEKALLAEVKSGDTVLIKASNSMNFKKLVMALQNSAEA